MAKNWSKYQLAIFDWVVNTKKSVCVDAKAGSGKSTTAIEAAIRASQANPRTSILFLAFNNSIAKKNAEDVKDYRNIESKTLHSYGFRAIFKTFGNSVKVDNNKWSDFVKNNVATLSSYITEDMSDENTRPFINNVIVLLNLCRINLIHEGEISNIEDIADRHNIEVLGDEVEVVNTLLGRVYEMNGKVIDFTDMITLPLTDANIGKRLGTYNIVFIDEAQDLSKAQQQLMLKAVNPKYGFFVAVGDPQQAINGFAGAMNDSFSKLVDLAQGRTLPLSVNYRCGKNIINLAQTIVPSIEAFEGSCDGEVKDVKDLKLVQAGDMLICRKSAPLVGLALKFIANGQSAFVKGKDLGVGLKNLIKKMKAKNIESLDTKLDKEYNKILANTIKNGGSAESPQPTAFADKVKCIRLIAESCLTINDIYYKLDALFDDVQNGRAICLSTIHKAKGLEANNVFILLPNKLPLVWKNQQPWEYEQEMNLKYVAITRAKKVLYWVNLEEEGLASLEL